MVILIKVTVEELLGNLCSIAPLLFQLVLIYKSFSFEGVFIPHLLSIFLGFLLHLQEGRDMEDLSYDLVEKSAKTFPSLSTMVLVSGWYVSL